MPNPGKHWKQSLQRISAPGPSAHNVEWLEVTENLCICLEAKGPAEQELAPNS